MKPDDRSPIDAPLGAFEEQVLVAVLRTAGESYGMEIRREIERVTGRELAIGAVYATLDRLEAKGLLRSSRTSVDGGAARRRFALTKAGVRDLSLTRQMHARLWRGVDLSHLEPG